MTIIISILFDKESRINRYVGRLNPYALSFAISNLWSKRSDRSVSNASKDLPLSRVLPFT